ncbi:MAG: type transport system ATP-binding protein, partial [Solirubrobacteraceae bacterium]|nr:type transport system ATP-binding protein [Solirubrobacteraceae bacterium]
MVTGDEAARLYLGPRSLWPVSRFLALAIAILACAWAAPAEAPAAPAYSKHTYVVAVSQPDEYGNPVSLDTDVYVPAGTPPHGGWPFVAFFHGGGSTKSNPFDSDHAARFAANGYATMLYSQRGHGNSNGETAVFGPKEIRDLFDVTAWALGIRGAPGPSHPDFHMNRDWVALSGYSQGGATTNLGQTWATDRAENPYGISFRAVEPGNTPDKTFEALVPHGVLKLSFGAGLLQTYLRGGSGLETHGRVAPRVLRWIATGTADLPSLYGGGNVCDSTGHDAPGSSIKADLAWRSVGCHPDRMALPWLWAQAFDDELFPADMALALWRDAPGRSRHRLYLSMGGHGAPSATGTVEEEKVQRQLAFMDAVRKGRRLPGPAVVYWTRDPRVPVPGDAYRYPPGAWMRQEATRWPPPGTTDVAFALGADGRAVRGAGKPGRISLLPVAADVGHDPVVASAASASPLGTSPVAAVPPTRFDHSIASFATDPFPTMTEMSGQPRALLDWTPASSDEQLALELFDESPGGHLTLISRGVLGMRGTAARSSRLVTIEANTFSTLIPAGHRVLAWLMAGDVPFYKPYA